MTGQARTPYGIVVGYDGSAGSQLALEWAAETARQQGKQLTLVHSVNVAAVPAYPAMDPNIEGFIGNSVSSLTPWGPGPGRDCPANQFGSEVTFTVSPVSLVMPNRSV